MDEIERMGGAVAAIEQGFYQGLIADEAYRKQQRVASGEDVVVGVNAYQDESAPSPERFDVPAELEPEQRAAGGGAAHRARRRRGRTRAVAAAAGRRRRATT